LLKPPRRAPHNRRDRLSGVAAAPTATSTATWTTEFDSQVGKQTYTYTFKVEGGTLTGHSKSNLGESDLTGTVDGDKVTFVENLNYQGTRSRSPTPGRSSRPTRSSSSATWAARAARSLRPSGRSLEEGIRPFPSR
jgi:hypothetical protein